MTLNIREGAYYRTRDGRKVGPAEADHQHIRYPWRVLGVGPVTKDGYFWTLKHGPRPHPFDLVAEWPDEAPCPGCGCAEHGTHAPGCDGEAAQTAPISTADIRPSDIVHVRMRATNRVEGSEILVDRFPRPGLDDGDFIWVSRSDIVHVEPRPPEPLKVGDHVRWTNDPGVFGIRAIIDGMAWIGAKSQEHVAKLSDLERVPA